MESEKPKFDFWVGIVSEGQAPQQTQAQMQAQATRQQIEDISTRLIKKVEKLYEGLRKLEWAGNAGNAHLLPGSIVPCCPVCRKRDAHKDDCWLAKLLETERILEDA